MRFQSQTFDIVMSWCNIITLDVDKIVYKCLISFVCGLQMNAKKEAKRAKKAVKREARKAAKEEEIAEANKAVEAVRQKRREKRDNEEVVEDPKPKVNLPALVRLEIEY